MAKLLLNNISLYTLVIMHSSKLVEDSSHFTSVELSLFNFICNIADCFYYLDNLTHW